VLDDMPKAGALVELTKVQSRFDKHDLSIVMSSD